MFLGALVSYGARPRAAEGCGSQDTDVTYGSLDYFGFLVFCMRLADQAVAGDVETAGHGDDLKTAGGY